MTFQTSKGQKGCHANMMLVCILYIQSTVLHYLVFIEHYWTSMPGTCKIKFLIFSEYGPLHLSDRSKFSQTDFHFPTFSWSSFKARVVEVFIQASIYPAINETNRCCRKPPGCLPTSSSLSHGMKKSDAKLHIYVGPFIWHHAAF